MSGEQARDAARFEPAQRIADAVLYAGHILYPYRASPITNQLSWQFGIVAPRAWSEPAGGEPWAMQTECLIEPAGTRPPHLDLRLRFLQLQSRQVEEAVAAADPAGADLFRPVASLAVGGETLTARDEGCPVRIDHAGIDLGELRGRELTLPWEVAGRREIELVPAAGATWAAGGGAARELALAGRIVRQRWPACGILRLSAETSGRLIKLRVRIENLTPWQPPLAIAGPPLATAGRPGAPAAAEPPAATAGEGEGRTGLAAGPDPRAEREAAMRQSLLGAHTLLAVHEGAFVSLLHPPAWAAEAARTCVNLHTWPVLAGPAGDRQVVLSSPVVLYDHPAEATESPGRLCEAPETSGILTCAG
jgi:hypothetical protein